MPNTQFEHTTVSAGNKGVWTFSWWVKRGKLALDQKIYSEYGSASDFWAVGFTGSDTLEFQNKDNGSNNLVYLTNRKFRDTNSWYHIVAAYDSSQASASDRFRVWINGVAETNWGSSTLPAQDNTDLSISKGSSGTYPPRIGSYTSAYFNGYIAQAVKVDGQSLAASNFGSTDATTGEWKPKSDGEIRTAVTAGSGWGTTGWMLTFQDTSNPGYDYKTSDRSSNLDFTKSGAGYGSQDNPSNSFQTLNPTWYSSTLDAGDFTNGNTQCRNNDNNNSRYGANMAVSKGKWYCELMWKGSVTWGGNAAGFYQYDYPEGHISNSNGFFSSDDKWIGIYINSNNVYVGNDGNNNNYGGSVAVNDVIGFAIDMDNGYFYVSHNGTWVNSGDPTSGATGTGNTNRTGNLNFDFTGLLMGIAGSAQNTDYVDWNFGNGYFGSTSAGATNADDAGQGVFKYDVPAGYYSMCTKNLNTYG